MALKTTFYYSYWKIKTNPKFFENFEICQDRDLHRQILHDRRDIEVKEVTRRKNLAIQVAIDGAIAVQVATENAIEAQVVIGNATEVQVETEDREIKATESGDHDHVTDHVNDLAIDHAIEDQKEGIVHQEVDRDRDQSRNLKDQNRRLCKVQKSN